MLFMDVYGDSMDESVEENPADKLTVPGNAFEGKSGGRLGYHQGWASGGPMFYRVLPCCNPLCPRVRENFQSLLLDLII